MMPKPGIHPDIRKLVKETGFKEDHITFEGRPVHRMAGPAKPQDFDDRLEALLVNVYYAQYNRWQTSVPAMTDNNLQWALSKSYGLQNQGQGRLETGWRKISDQPGGSILLERDGERSVVRKDRATPDEAGGWMVRLPPGSELIQPSFYFAFSDLAYEISPPQIRVYFHASLEGAPKLVESLTRNLNQHGLAFSFKIIQNPHGFRRADAAVLYLNRTDWTTAWPVIRQVWKESSPWLRQETPLFTKPLGWGLALAETPKNGDSFGMHRSKVLASTILQALKEKKNRESIMKGVAYRFRELELDPERPYLSEGSTHEY